jgi:hypothetical protein
MTNEFPEDARLDSGLVLLGIQVVESDGRESVNVYLLESRKKVLPPTLAQLHSVSL